MKKKSKCTHQFFETILYFFFFIQIILMNMTNVWTMKLPSVRIIQNTPEKNWYWFKNITAATSNNPKAK